MEHPQYAYFEGQFVPYTDAKVGVLTHALNYGTSVFGGLRGYWNEEQKQLYVFRPLDHFKRFINSSRLIRMDLGQTPESLRDITLELLRREGYQQDVYIRPLAYKADEGIGVRLHNLRDALTVVSLPMGLYVDNDTNAHVTVSSWRRVDDNSIPARGKIGGAYVNSSLIKTDAHEAGFDEAIVLNQDGHVSEGSAMNVFMVRDGVLVTPPITDNILEGITRRTVIELAKQELQIPVIERSVDRTELYICEELFFSGTAAQITAITQIDHRSVGSGKMGPISAQLRAIFSDVVHGKLAKYQNWLAPVYTR